MQSPRLRQNASPRNKISSISPDRLIPFATSNNLPVRNNHVIVQVPFKTACEVGPLGEANTTPAAISEIEDFGATASRNSLAVIEEQFYDERRYAALLHSFLGVSCVHRELFFLTPHQRLFYLALANRQSL